MNKISTSVSKSFLIKKSTFISYVFPCENVEELKLELASFWKQHPKATHICVAFVGSSVDDIWFDDDGEPTHSAGKVMLNVLLKQNLIKTGAFVIRYYGGIQLGVGGLVKAYTSAISETLKESPISLITYQPYVTCKLCFEHGFPLWETLKRKKIHLDVSVHEEYLDFSIQASKQDLSPYLSSIPSLCLCDLEEKWKEI